MNSNGRGSKRGGWVEGNRREEKKAEEDSEREKRQTEWEKRVRRSINERNKASQPVSLTVNVLPRKMPLLVCGQTWHQ